MTIPVMYSRVFGEASEENLGNVLVVQDHPRAGDVLVVGVHATALKGRTIKKVGTCFRIKVEM